MSPRKKKKHKKLRLLKKIIDIGVFLLIVLVITYLLNNYVVERCQVHNHSMEPTLNAEDVLLIDKFTYTKRAPKRYEIITFKNESDGEELIKRVFGLPGETVTIIHGKIYIDGNLIKDYKGLEPPIEPGLAEIGFELSEDEFFVLGDNREVSIDSRYKEIGAVHLDSIIGKTICRIKPLSKFIIK